MKNWKTTLFGGSAGAAQLAKGFVNPKYHGILDASSGLLLALMGAFAKDNNVTGGTVQQ
jgi:hypothetical protein